MMDRKRLITALAGGLGVVSAAGVAQAQATFDYGSNDAARAYEAELLADASVRTSNLATAGAGYEKGKFFISDGEANTLNIGGQIQARYLVNIRDDAVGGNEDFTSGFQMRRTRLNAGGTIWDKSFNYYIQGEFSRSSGNFGLLDAFGNYKFENGVNVRFGQYKTPGLREELISSKYQLAVDRSVVNTVFTLGRSQGLGIGYTTESFRLMADYSDGLNTLNTDFNSDAEADFALTARGEFRWGADDFKRFDDFTSWRESEYAGLAGVGLHYQSGGDTGGPTEDEQIFQLTADITAEGSGWNAFAQGVFRTTDPAVGDSTDDYGVVIQGGVFVAEQFELFARYDVVVPDDAGGEDPFSTVTAGVNYYVSPKSHAAKLSADVVYYLDAEGEVGIVSPSTSVNLLADNEDGQIGIRVQMQILF